MPKDYYLILGIASDASVDDIKTAYRRLAKEYHPDRYGENHSPFLAIQEAYAVLSDPIKRQVHDLDVSSQKKKLNQSYGKNRSGPKRDVEPLIPGQKGRMDFGSRDLERVFHPHRPPADQYFDSMFSNFRQTGRPVPEPVEQLRLVLPLTAEQALQGGQIRVLLPVELRCPSCSGKGWMGVYRCWRCNGGGSLSGEYPVMVSYPPGRVKNWEIQVPLDACGLKKVCLRVLFRISDML